MPFAAVVVEVQSVALPHGNVTSGEAAFGLREGREPCDQRPRGAVYETFLVGFWLDVLVDLLLGVWTFPLGHFPFGRFRAERARDQIFDVLAVGYDPYPESGHFVGQALPYAVVYRRDVLHPERVVRHVDICVKRERGVGDADTFDLNPADCSFTFDDSGQQVTDPIFVSLRQRLRIYAGGRAYAYGRHCQTAHTGISFHSDLIRRFAGTLFCESAWPYRSL